MKRLALAALLAFAAPAAASAADVTGAWKLDASVPSYNFNFTLTCSFKQDADKLGGDCKDAQGASMAATGTVAANAVTFAYDTTFAGNPLHVVYKATVQDDGTLKGDFDAGQATGTFTGKKQ